MKLFKGYVLLSREEQMTRDDEMFTKGEEYGKKSSKDRIESLERAVERKNKENEKLERRIEDLEAKVEVYEEDRDNSRDVIKQKIENDDLRAILDAKKDGLDKKEARLKDRAARLDEEEAGEYKKGYADGVADGIRKISEITQADRDNAMKVAMVAAASHTPADNLKELNNVHQLTEGSKSTN